MAILRRSLTRRVWAFHDEVFRGKYRRRAAYARLKTYITTVTKPSKVIRKSLRMPAKAERMLLQRARMGGAYAFVDPDVPELAADSLEEYLDYGRAL